MRLSCYRSREFEGTQLFSPKEMFVVQIAVRLMSISLDSCWLNHSLQYGIDTKHKSRPNITEMLFLWRFISTNTNSRAIDAREG